MALISSISGIRGTIGGGIGNNLTPDDILLYTRSFAEFIRQSCKKDTPRIVIGRDARVSGQMVEALVVGTLMACGVDCIVLGITTTPTTEMAVPFYHADGGIIITASHNPVEWNALKLLNNKGEFISAEDGQIIVQNLKNSSFEYAKYDKLGQLIEVDNFIQNHIKQIINLKLVDVDSIRKANFRIVADAINSSGAIALPLLFDALGVNQYTILNNNPNGLFAHNAEPLPENLTELSKAVVENKADLGIAVDPDVDRLALVMENGEMFGEEYTLVAVADYVLQHTPGNTVSNMSSTQALKIVTEKYNQNHYSSAVGEVNVVARMKEVNAVIGGEGNGGVIYPELHYGRDALVGIALFLSYLAKTKLSASHLRKTYPDFFISKQKIELKDKVIDFKGIANKISDLYKDATLNFEDGLKIVFPDNDWVHLRPSNTEPIVRIYAESNSMDKSKALATKIKTEIEKML